jgi:putative ABC transport system permease protein
MSQINNIIRLSFRDYIHEWRMSGCFVFALSSVLAPMMILFGLKFGIVNNMVSSLIENPVNREIKPIGSGRYDQTWIDNYQSMGQVEFIIPKTRALAATVQLKSGQASRILSTEMLATAQNDPLLSLVRKFPRTINETILSEPAATKLGVAVGQIIEGSLARQYQGKRERVHFPLTVIDIAGKGVTARSVAFVSLDLLLATENFKDGRSVPVMGWEGLKDSDDPRIYPSFRLYAQSIYDVEKLAKKLEGEGIRIKAKSAEIQTVQSIDQNLSLIFWIIACVGAIGYCFSLGASLWANVDRKRKDLSVLRLVGFKSGRIVMFPVLQSGYTAILGWLLAVLIYLSFEQLLNRFLAPRLELEGTICYLLAEHFFWALGLTLVTSLIAAILGGLRAAAIEPSDGLRDI